VRKDGRPGGEGANAARDTAGGGKGGEKCVGGNEKKKTEDEADTPQKRRKAKWTFEGMTRKKGR